MLSILNKTGSRLEIGTLFIQPTRWCSINCKKCYVTEHVAGEDDYHTPVNEQFKLFKEFFRGDIAWANQITISIDNLPRHSNANHDHVYHMLQYWHSVLDYLYFDTREKGDRPEVHMTCNSDKVWRQYCEALKMDKVTTAGLLDVLSFSNIIDLDFVKNIAKFTHINYNHLIPTNVTSFNIKRHIQRMIEIGRSVDSIYFIVSKSPIGAVRNELTQIGDQQRMASDLSYIKTMLERLPSDIRAKVHVDGCVKDVEKAKATGFGCSSNVSRFQVWPDGSVSGCPYAFSSNTGRGERAKDILANIREARGTYDFKERCHLPELIDSNTG